MNARKFAWLGGIAVIGTLCWLAAAGVTPLIGILLTAAALVALIAFGNWFSPHSSGSGTGVDAPTTASGAGEPDYGPEQPPA